MPRDGYLRWQSGSAARYRIGLVDGDACRQILIVAHVPKAARRQCPLRGVVRAADYGGRSDCGAPVA
jgi:hypothetical protein